MSTISSISRRTLLASTVLISSAFAAGDTPPYRQASLPIDERVRDLLSRMTLEEKVAQMRCLWFDKASILDESGAFSAEQAAAAIPQGIGQIGRPSDTAGSAAYARNAFRTLESTVAFINAAQRYLVEQTRLGVPALFHEETAHGYAAAGATIFPIPPALGSTWDPELIERVFAVAGREARLRGATVALSPVIDLMREPRFGRSEEFYGEDPHLVGQMGVAAVRGQQGRERPLARDKVFATLKHFVHGSPQGGLNIAPSDMSERMLRENYLAPFADVIRDADPAIIMPSYNEIAGIPAHGNRELLQSTGRERLGFKGAYFSDYGGIGTLVSTHRMAASDADAAILALNAGVDADLPEGQCYKLLPELVRSGRVSEDKINLAVSRILTLKFEAGLFENPYVDAGLALRETNTQAAIELARTTAEKALILLKNDGVAPLNPRRPVKLAVIGPNAAQPIYGGYSGQNERGVSILAGLQALAGPNISIEHSDGVWITRPVRSTDPARAPVLTVRPEENAARITEAVAVAQRSDVVLLVVGDNPTITREAVMRGQPGDRNSLGLFGQQDELFDALHVVGKPIIVLLLNGRPLSTTKIAERANALFEGWYLGQEGGTAFANVLFGHVNPGGKLTVSVPRSVGESPAFYNRHPSADANRYVEGDRTPLYPFGHGLSYTSFEISEPRLVRDQIQVGETAVLDVDVTNTGSRTGDEVVQIYVRDDVSSAPRPILELKAFQRVSLRPGQRRRLRFELKPDALAFWNIDMNWAVEPGTFTISAGASSQSLKSTSLTVS